MYCNLSHCCSMDCSFPCRADWALDLLYNQLRFSRVIQSTLRSLASPVLSGSIAESISIIWVSKGIYLLELSEKTILKISYFTSMHIIEIFIIVLSIHISSTELKLGITQIELSWTGWNIFQIELRSSLDNLAQQRSRTIKTRE